MTRSLAEPKVNQTPRNTFEKRFQYNLSLKSIIVKAFFVTKIKSLAFTPSLNICDKTVSNLLKFEIHIRNRLNMLDFVKIYNKKILIGLYNCIVIFN